ncbi:MAG: CHC2 zinc finger domain-containing protein [Dehalococcoidia bacterium]
MADQEREIIAAIEEAIASRQPRREGRETRFLCPAHDDHSPSARWHPEKHVWCCDACGAGGGYVNLAELLGVPHSQRGGLSVAELADAKGLSEKFLRDLGVTDGIVGASRTPCVDIPYDDRTGEVIAVRKRLNLKGEHRFSWRRGDHPYPYGLWAVREARERTNYLLFVEGESDTWVCKRAGVTAVGIPGASTMKTDWAPLFEGIPHLFVWQEPGPAGITFVEKVAAALPTVQVITAPVDAKDAADLWLVCNRDADEFQARIAELARSAPYVSAIKADTSRQDARESLAKAWDLFLAPDLLAKVETAMRDLGYAGDTKPPMLAYVALTSRLLRRPLNLAFVAPSAAGKNRAIDAALALMPESAYYLEKAGSARALIYSDASYEHRAVVVAEADSLPNDDSSAASAVRSLAADNEMTYDVVEKDSKGEFHVRRITKPGPTGLVTTSTRPLPHQFDTRTLTVTVADTPGQTRDVMRAHAATLNGLVALPDVSDFVALQRWLELEGKREVLVPFAPALAELVPADHVRMRRDFRQLLTTVETMAILHQQQRELDADGRIVATLDDYEHARTLLMDVFQAASSAGVTPQVRETVEAVNRIADGVSLTKQAIADALKLSKDTAWYRIKRAISLGHLINDETRKGRPAQIRPGDPLPEDRPALPTVEELSACVSRHPAVDSTVQPRRTLEAEGESGKVVESVVESGIQPHVQPDRAPAPDSPARTAVAVVERLNGDPGSLHTPDGREVMEI